MIDFEGLKRCYAATIQYGLAANAGYDNSKQGNEVLHKFCESLIDNSNNKNKEAMKQELALLKETFAKEIESYFKNK